MAEIRVAEPAESPSATSPRCEDSTFTVEDGEFFCLLGPSGCGKTTTLRMIAGLELPTSGEIRLGGDDVTFKRASERDIAFVFQLFALYPHMNVRRNIAFPLVSQGVPRAEITAARRGGGADPAHLRSPRQPRLRPLRRRPPARRARPRHRAPADGLHDGRAARRARRRVPPHHVRRAARAARPPEGDDDLRHPRPARGHVDGRQDRRDERRRHRAARHPRARSTTGRPPCSSPISSARRR